LDKLSISSAKLVLAADCGIYFAPVGIASRDADGSRRMNVDRAAVARGEADVSPEERGAVWTEWLLGSEAPGALDLDVALDEANQRVVACDCRRTRCLHAEFTEERQRLMERMLTCYCKQRNLKYKQGMNEVLAPFVYLHARDLCTVEQCYALFDAFLGKYLLPLYADDDFVGLQAAFALFKGLFAYHLPRLHALLEQHEVGPELYASWWVLTLFGSKTELKSVLAVWDAYIAEDDPVFFQFIGLAMLEKEAPSLYDADPASLPESLSNFAVTDPKDLWQRARALRDQTPDSFAHRVRSALWMPAPDSKEDNSIFFTLGAEVVRHCYGGATGSWRLFLFDLRSNREFCAGHFPMAVNLPADTRRDAEEVKKEMHDAGWRPNSGLHVVLVPRTGDTAGPLFRCLTRELNVPHVSIVCRSPEGVCEQ
jgi:hypothetical protein